jgi:AcrR family transcriptional regulator
LVSSLQSHAALLMETAELPRLRATRDDEKRSRYHAILDAAERLLSTEPDRVSIMADVAAAAGLAKGTVYLYFPSKEALMLALHDRHTEGFFEAMIARLQSPERLTLAALNTVVRERIAAHPAYLPCASVCFGYDRTMPAEPMQAHMMRVANWLDATAHGLNRQLPNVSHAEAIVLLRRSYAMILGLWQLLKPESQARIARDSNVANFCHAEYVGEVDAALTALWSPFFSAQAARKSAIPAAQF